MPRRLLVIGGDAAGMSAASTAKRALRDDLDVVVLERSGWTSYSACGIPYWVAGDVGSPHDLVARTPEEHREAGIDVRTGTTATALDLSTAAVTACGADGTTSTHPYDELVIATGAEPLRLDVPGSDADGIHPVQTLDDGATVIEALEQRPRRVVVVGAGYIGLEMAEACVRRGLQTVVVTKDPTPMPTLDADLGRRVAAEMRADGIDVRTDVDVTGYEVGDDGRVTDVVMGDARIACDLVLLGVGVRPRTDLAADAGVELADSGALRVDARGRVQGVDASNVWAAGDCVETWHRITRQPAYVPLGTHANKQGRVIGRNLAGVDDEFEGVLGTAMTKVVSLEIARTGLGEAEATDAGFDAVAVTVDATTSAGYMPDAQEMTMKVVAERGTRRLLGAHILGRRGAALRIDSFALALWNEMTVDDLVMSDLGYAPPYSSVWDPVQQAARIAASAL